jgi:uncharacterized membrane protein
MTSVPRFRLLLTVVLVLGAAARLVLAFATEGVRPDLESFRVVADALNLAPGHVYDLANAHPPFVRWPYPPGFFPLIVAADGAAKLGGLDFLALIRLPAIVADIAIAWLVQDYLRRRGRGEGARLAAAALVALGPSFAAVSGFHGQIDAVAILPAVAALVVWDHSDAPWRPYAAGGLIGLGASVKTIPLVLLLALVPASRSPGEAARLVGSAVVVPLAAVAPFVLSEGTGWLRVFRYNGAPGLGGLSLLAQPDLAPAWFGVGHARLSGLTRALFDASRTVALATVLATGAFLLRFRAPAVLGAVMVWLTIYVFGITFFMQYMVWGLPFFLMAGYLREVLVLELVLLPPVLVTYAGVSQAWVVDVFYVVPMLAVWAGMTVALVLMARRLARAARTTQAEAA